MRVFQIDSSLFEILVGQFNLYIDSTSEIEEKFDLFVKEETISNSVIMCTCLGLLLLIGVFSAGIWVLDSLKIVELKNLREIYQQARDEQRRSSPPPAIPGDQDAPEIDDF